MWRIQLFGGIQAVSGETVVSHFETRRAACLLAYLAMHRGRTHTREALAEMLWPDEDTDATRDRLRQALAAIRRALEPDGAVNGSVLKADRSEVGLAVDRFETDVHDFALKVKAAERATEPLEQLALLREAVENYRGEL